MLKDNVQHYQHALPLCGLQQASIGGFYYKTLERVSQGKVMQIRVGVRVAQVQKFQQDHVAYIIQTINYNSVLFKLVFLTKDSLFLQTTPLIVQSEAQICSQYIIKQRKIFHRLNQFAEALKEVIKQELSADIIISQKFSGQRFSFRVKALVQRFDERGEKCK